MKTTLLFSLLLFILSSCKNTGAEITEHEKQIMTELSEFFKGEVKIRKRIYLDNADQKMENNYVVALNTKGLEKFYSNAEQPASYCAWYVYNQLPESDRKLFGQFTIELPFDNQQKIFDFKSEDLDMVLKAKTQLDSLNGYFLRGDYQTMKEKCIPYMQQDSSAAQLWKSVGIADSKFGRTKEVKLFSLRIMSFVMDSIHRTREPFVQFQMVQVRDKANMKFSAIVRPDTLNGFIAGMWFE
jgi:hypothetical protein